MNRLTIILMYLLLLTGIGALAGYLIVSKIIRRDHQQLNSMIEVLFGGKISVSDGQRFAVEGEFSDANKLNYSLKSGGFTIIDLTRESNGFVKTITISGDLKYKEAETTWISTPHNNFPWGEVNNTSRDGYSISNHRSDIQNCYTSSYDYILRGGKNDPKDSYKPNVFIDLKNFPDGYSTKYYLIDYGKHPTELYGFRNGAGKVYSVEYELTYLTKEFYCEIKPLNKKIQKVKLIFIGGGAGIGLIITLIILSFIKNPKLQDSYKTMLFDKKWKDVDDNTILTIHSSQFGKFSATLVKDNKPIYGKAIINNNTIELNFREFQYYYSIVKVNENELVLTDEINNKSVIYQKLGYKKPGTTPENVSV
jgi:hypothetical protein